MRSRGEKSRKEKTNKADDCGVDRVGINGGEQMVLSKKKGNEEKGRTKRKRGGRGSKETRSLNEEQMKGWMRGYEKKINGGK